MSQTYRNIEIIIVDDGFTDSSLCVANRFKSDNVKVVSLANKGAAAARNIGLQMATGEYVQFLDADDKLDKQKIELQIDV